MDHAVGDAVHGAVGGLGREIIEHDHGGVVLGKIVLQREDLTPVPQRALRQEPYLRQTIDDDALRSQPLDRIEDALDGFAEFEVGGIKQALMLVGIEHAFRRYQFEDLDLRADGPAMRPGAIAQLVLGFGEADVDPGFADLAAREQELQGNGCLARAGAALEQVQAITGQTAA